MKHTPIDHAHAYAWLNMLPALASSRLMDIVPSYAAHQLWQETHPPFSATTWSCRNLSAMSAGTVTTSMLCPPGGLRKDRTTVRVPSTQSRPPFPGIRPLQVMTPPLPSWPMQRSLKRPCKMLGWQRGQWRWRHVLANTCIDCGNIKPCSGGAVLMYPAYTRSTWVSATH
jgi:hypothetical protein